MISGDKERPVTKYLPIDHVGEGYAFVSPREGECFFGIPYGWHTENSEAFIEVRQNGVVMRTVNARDISEIEFMDTAAAELERERDE